MVLAATACVQCCLFLTMLQVSLEDFQSSMVKYMCEVQYFNKTMLDLPELFNADFKLP